MVGLLLTVSVLPFAMVRVALAAGCVIVSLLKVSPVNGTVARLTNAETGTLRVVLLWTMGATSVPASGVVAAGRFEMLTCACAVGSKASSAAAMAATRIVFMDLTFITG